MHMGIILEFHNFYMKKVSGLLLSMIEGLIITYKIILGSHLTKHLQ